jgi:hypothetical protein
VPPPATIPNQSDTRTRWVGKGGQQFVNIGDKTWSERKSGGKQIHICDEVTRTELYVEIRRREGLRIRLFDDHIDFKAGKPWQRAANGSNPKGLPVHGSWR